jgi:hypothetical protein
MSGVLVIIALISLVSFFGPHIVIQWRPERHVTVELGPAFSPWFRSETGRRWHDMSSWSWVLVPVAFLAWYIRWQIVKTQAAAEGRTPRWIDAPIALIVIALAMYACMTVVAIVLPHSSLDVAWDAALNELVPSYFSCHFFSIPYVVRRFERLGLCRCIPERPRPGYRRRRECVALWLFPAVAVSLAECLSNRNTPIPSN